MNPQEAFNQETIKINFFWTFLLDVLKVEIGHGKVDPLATIDALYYPLTGIVEVTLIAKDDHVRIEMTMTDINIREELQKIVAWRVVGQLISYLPESKEK